MDFVSTVDSRETMEMWDTILAAVFSALLGLLGLGIAGWQIATFQAFHSLDNIFLTLVGLLLAVIGFGYLAMILGPLFSAAKKGKD
jgi:hypothetical protein